MKKTNNKGFSLVELIIVVAIMAVLVGVLAPQYIKYLDKSKKGVDEQMADNLRQAMTTCYLDPNVTGKPTTGGSLGSPSGTPGEFWEEVKGIMGTFPPALKLDPTGGSISYTLANDKFKVTISGGKYTGALEIEIE